MTRGILIAGNDSPVLAAVAREALKRVTTVVVARAPDRRSEGLGVSASGESGQGEAGASGSRLSHAPSSGVDDGVSILWNPGSPISARSVLISAENALGSISEAILVCSPTAVRRRLHELVPADVDQTVDDLVKGWILMAREIALSFKRHSGGSLAFVLSEAGLNATRDDPVDLIGGAVAAAFRGFAQAAVSASVRDDGASYGFSSAEAMDDAGFASFVFKILDEGNKRDLGRWHKYSKSGLFGLR